MSCLLWGFLFDADDSRINFAVYTCNVVENTFIVLIFIRVFGVSASLIQLHGMMQTDTSFSSPLNLPLSNMHTGREIR